MPHIVLTLREWRAIAHELIGPHTRVPPVGLRERLEALMAEAPCNWPDQTYALELSEASAEAVWRVHAALNATDLRAGQGRASVAAAMRVIRDHQQPS
jgi:hypothetical protein